MWNVSFGRPWLLSCVGISQGRMALPCTYIGLNSGGRKERHPERIGEHSKSSYVTTMTRR